MSLTGNVLTVRQLFMHLLKEVEKGNGDAVIYICDVEHEFCYGCESVFEGTLENIELENGEVLAKGIPLYV